MKKYSDDKNKHYTIKVGSEEIKVWASDIDEAKVKALEIWHKKKGFHTKFEPPVYIIDIE